MNEQDKKKTKKIVILAIMGVFAGLLLYSGANLIQYFKDEQENKIIQEVIEESIEINDENETPDKKYIIDFENLKAQNPDTVAYLKVYGTTIDYVVVRADDNYYYLKHNFNRTWSIPGWVFVDYRNALDGNDKNIIIYGHNMSDGTMLGSLNQTLTREWQDIPENREIVFVTEKGVTIYEVFSTYEILPESFYITTTFKNDEEYQNFLNTLYYRSNYNYGVPVNKDDEILTLSTCVGNGEKRVVLHAKKQK